MSDSFPAEIRVSESDTGVVYRLPRRMLGCTTIGGLVVLLLGLLACAASAGVFVLAALTAKHGSLAMGILVGVVIGLPFVLLGLFLCLLGLWLSIGHTVIRLENTRLAANFKIGPWALFWQQRKLTDVRRFVLRSDGEQKTPVLSAICQQSRPMNLGSLYPYEWLWQLGQDLAERRQAQGVAGVNVIGLEEEWTDFTGERQLPSAWSRVIVETSPDGTTYRVPAAGWLDGGCLILGFMGIVFVLVAFGLSLLVAPFEVALALVGCFGLAGGGFMLGAFVLARRQVVLAVKGDTLTITRTGLSTSTRSWTRDELEAIRAVRELRKRTTVDDEGRRHTRWEWLVELQIHPFKGRALALSGRYGLDGRAVEQEWEWLATALREALEVPA